MFKFINIGINRTGQLEVYRILPQAKFFHEEKIDYYKQRLVRYLVRNVVAENIYHCVLNFLHCTFWSGSELVGDSGGGGSDSGGGVWQNNHHLLQAVSYTAAGMCHDKNLNINDAGKPILIGFLLTEDG